MTRDEPIPSSFRGLYGKYRVERTDGKSAPGAKHHGCEYFVLDLTHDRFAREALTAYARACADEYPTLANDLHRKLGWSNEAVLRQIIMDLFATMRASTEYRRRPNDPQMEMLLADLTHDYREAVKTSLAARKGLAS
jgi:hypothetical protein